MFEVTLHTLPKVGRRKDDWWRGAVIYQIYPRSFQDADGNGIGDLPGITQRLDYVASLGVDAIWISPFMKSPMKDYGYDVADYSAVDPMFGTLDDFDALIDKAHGLGLKVLIDYVPSHTSDQHEWFKEARQDRTNPKADWYVFADAKPDGSPPNNWLAVFGGSSWEWEPRRGQYYLHNFLKEQPDLNFHNPEVIAALLGEAEFWLKRGIDGFRIDAIDFGVHDKKLRDNPPRPPEKGVATGGIVTSPFGMQIQLYNKARPELSDLFFKPMFDLTERYDGKMLLGEIAGDRALERIAEYSDGGGLDMAYSFDLLGVEPTAKDIRRIIAAAEEHVGEGWAAWSFGNHDVRRPVSRFARDGQAPEALRKLIPVLLTSLRGTVCIYQGEELGLDEAELTFEELRDPFGITFWPVFKGRDGCRTPMPWERGLVHCGFSDARPWLPIPHGHAERAVDVQSGHAGTCLESLRAFLAWRKGEPLLQRGKLRFVDVKGNVLCFVRSGPTGELLCAFNLDPAEATIALPAPAVSAGCPIDTGEITQKRVRLPGYGAFFGRLTNGV